MKQNCYILRTLLCLLLFPLYLNAEDKIKPLESPLLTDQFLQNLIPNKWVKIKIVNNLKEGSSEKVSSQGWTKLVYDSVNNRILLVDRWIDKKRGMGTYIYANTLIGFNPANLEIKPISLFNWKRRHNEKTGGYNTKEMPENKINPTPVPRHPYGNVAFIPKTNEFYLSTGANGSGGHQNNTWKYSFTHNKWSKLNGSSPSLSFEDCMTYVPTQNAIYRYVCYRRTMYKLDLNSNAGWKATKSSKLKPVSLGAAMTYDSKRDTLLLMGSGNKRKPNKELWSYNIKDDKWTKLPSEPNAYMAGWVYAKKHDMVLLHRNKLNDDPHSSFWIYFPGEKKWLSIKLSGKVPSKNATIHSIAYDSKRDLFFCINGGWKGLNWYALKLDPLKIKGIPKEYKIRMAK